MGKIKKIIVFLVLTMLIGFGGYYGIKYTFAADDLEFPDIKADIDKDTGIVRIPKEDFIVLLNYVRKIRNIKDSTERVCRNEDKDVKPPEPGKSEEGDEYQLPKNPDDVVIPMSKFENMMDDIVNTVISKKPKIVSCTSV